MNDKQREIVRDNYNAIAKRVADELLLLHPNHAFDPVQLAHHTSALIDELKAQRDQAIRERDTAFATIAMLHYGSDVHIRCADGTVAIEGEIPHV